MSQRVFSSLELSVKPLARFPCPPRYFIPLCWGCLLICSPPMSLCPLPTAIPWLQPGREQAQPDSSLPLLAMLMVGPAEQAV